MAYSLKIDQLDQLTLLRQEVDATTPISCASNTRLSEPRSAQVLRGDTPPRTGESGIGCED